MLISVMVEANGNSGHVLPHLAGEVQKALTSATPYFIEKSIRTQIGTQAVALFAEMLDSSLPDPLDNLTFNLVFCEPLTSCSSHELPI